MHDSKRIKPFCDKLVKIWEKLPDWRFGQLMSNFFIDLQKDPFFLEDEEMINYLENYINSLINYKE